MPPTHAPMPTPLEIANQERFTGAKLFFAPHTPEALQQSLDQRTDWLSGIDLPKVRRSDADYQLESQVIQTRIKELDSLSHIEDKPTITRELAEREKRLTKLKTVKLKDNEKNLPGGLQREMEALRDASSRLFFLEKFKTHGKRGLSDSLAFREKMLLTDSKTSPNDRIRFKREINVLKKLILEQNKSALATLRATVSYKAPIVETHSPQSHPILKISERDLAPKKSVPRRPTVRVTDADVSKIKVTSVEERLVPPGLTTEQKISFVANLNRFHGITNFIERERARLHASPSESWQKDPNWRKRWLGNHDITDITERLELPMAYLMRGGHAVVLLSPPENLRNGAYRLKIYDPKQDGEMEMQIKPQYNSDTTVAGDKIFFSGTFPLEKQLGILDYDEAARTLSGMNYDIHIPNFENMEWLAHAKRTRTQIAESHNCTLWSIYHAAIAYVAQPGDLFFKKRVLERFRESTGVTLLTYEDISPEPEIKILT